MRLASTPPPHIVRRLAALGRTLAIVAVAFPTVAAADVVSVEVEMLEEKDELRVALKTLLS